MGFQNKIKTRHLTTAKRVLRYLKRTKGLRLVYTSDATGSDLHGFVDADHVNSKCKKSTLVALSTEEAEYNVLGLVPDRGRVTDHPRSASYSSKLPTFTTLPDLVTTGGLCVASNWSILHTGAPSGFRMLSIFTEESSYSSISLPPPPSSIASSPSVSSLLLSRLREFFLIPIPLFYVLF